MIILLLAGLCGFCGLGLIYARLQSTPQRPEGSISFGAFLLLVAIGAVALLV